jgi:hypothetical protein
LDGGEPDLDGEQPAMDAGGGDDTEPNVDDAATMDDSAALEDASADSTQADRPCQGVDASYYCEDFEQAVLEGVFDWEELTPDTGASLSLVEEGREPGPRVLKATLTGVDGEVAREVIVLQESGLSWVRVAFDIQAQANFPPSSDGAVYWFKLAQQSGDGYPGGVSLATTATSGTLLLIQNFDGTTESVSTPPIIDLPAGWVHVDMEITLGSSGSITVRYDDRVAAQYVGPVHVVDVTRTYVQLGIYAQKAAASWAMYDNIAFQYRM